MIWKNNYIIRIAIGMKKCKECKEYNMMTLVRVYSNGDVIDLQIDERQIKKE